MSRVIILEFNKPDIVFKGEEKAFILQNIHEKKSVASSVIGKLINFAYNIYQVPQLKMSVSTSFPSQLIDKFDALLPRLLDTYSIWLYTLVKVSCIIVVHMCGGECVIMVDGSMHAYNE